MIHTGPAFFARLFAGGGKACRSHVVDRVVESGSLLVHSA